MTSLLCLIGLIALPVSCLAQQEFLNPLYTQQDLTSDRLLPGTWEAGVVDPRAGVAASIVLKFQPGKGGCYDLTLNVVSQDACSRDSDKIKLPLHMKLHACLVHLGQMVFLDVQAKTVPIPATTETFRLDPSARFNHKNPFSPGLFHIAGADLSVGTGMFVTVAPAGGGRGTGAHSHYELRLTPAHWISRVWISEKTLRLSDFDPDGDFATLSTRELQQLVLKYFDKPGASENADELKRKEGGSQ